ncbi:MAG: hypothetical protein BWY11_00893 [Firmicutes bacterium ADurb.Bin182]|nr:MAG: hypothetical protein BWY11_00893 [Firmicutes bacterium ADurb.Bin182]
MEGLFTWAILATYAGATLATALITEIFKGVGFIDRIPTRIFSYFVALLVLIAANFFTDQLTWATALLSLVNAVVVSLASNGAYDFVNMKKK